MTRLNLSIACLSLAGLLTAGCTFSSGSSIDDDNFGGSNGFGEGGEGGTSADAGTGGTGGAEDYVPNMVCEADAPNRAPDDGECGWLDPDGDNDCEACLAGDLANDVAGCCEEVNACSTIPEHQCFYGGEDLDGDDEPDGEWRNVRDCLAAEMANEENAGIDAGILLDDCLDFSGTLECGGGASVATTDLALCALVECPDVCF